MRAKYTFHDFYDFFRLRTTKCIRYPDSSHQMFKTISSHLTSNACRIGGKLSTRHGVTSVDVFDDLNPLISAIDFRHG